MTGRPSRADPLGHLVWWTGDLRSPGAATLEQTLRAGVPVLDRSGVVWLSPEFDVQLEALRSELAAFHGGELHTVPVRNDGQTLDALRSSALRWMEVSLGELSAELEALLSQPRLRASVLVRKLDVLDALRRQADLQRRHLALTHEGLLASLDWWAERIDSSLCARIVA